MGKQIRFYRNDSIEADLISKCLDLGLSRYENDNGTFFAYENPNEIWLEADAIQYTSRVGVNKSEGRFWSGSNSPEFKSIFQKLIRYIKSKSNYHSESSLWVNKEYKDEYLAYYQEKEKKLQELLQKNKEYAVNVLGAKLVSDDKS